MNNSTICAMANAPGGAIAIIRVSGPMAIECVSRIFVGKRKDSNLTLAAGYTVHYGTIVAKRDDTGENNLHVIDDVLVTIFRAPHSYTGEDSVEISCHGSSYVIQKILSLLISEGCSMAEPGEYTKRAFLNGKLDLTQAEAVADLIASQTESQHLIAMRQMRGSVSGRLGELRDKLLEMTSLLELELDFSEEDVEFADRQKLAALTKDIKEEIARLASSFDDGNAIKNGVPVAIIGPPNVGKSTLLNALLGEDKAIVSDIQGTTRDVIEDTVTIGGVLFRFLDTAGIRHTDDTIEQLGIERSLKAASSASIIISVNEPGIPFADIVIRPGQHIIHVTNKTRDFQAINGTGLEWLRERLADHAPRTDSSAVLITNMRHKQALECALSDITKAENALACSLTG
ncbi:MAG: tRNA uridine-5-carboxymethylaminomethyl(34) synthesis GTPase MnmE, partial [Bacteroidales bacterium]|nr:tRNA uridine-5-carboxymethylaminomethyl(34) synthesis GTPase MnmE [Bacteroidales bacterium]